jgi:hypothetical protein
MEQLQHRKAGFRNIEFVMADATTAVPLDRDLVVFLYNPFGPDLMTRLSEHLRASSVQIHIYYANPIHPDAIERIADSSEAIPGFIPVRYFHLRRQGQIRNSPRLVQR